MCNYKGKRKMYEKEKTTLKKLYHKNAVLPSLEKRYTKQEVEQIIEENYGILTIICAILDCTPKQFYKAIDKWGLRNYLTYAKNNLVGVAEKAILDCLRSENENIKLKSAEITLKSLGKDTWSQSPQVQITQNVVSDEEKKIEIKNIFGIQ